MLTNEVLNTILGLMTAYKSQTRINSLEQVYAFVLKQQKELEFWKGIVEKCECKTVKELDKNVNR